MKKIRVGILGGTFNPVHKGHITLGLKVKEIFKLDKVLYILSARPPHKDNTKVVEPDKRFEMLKKTLDKFEGLEASDIEIKRNKPSWTIDTVKQLKRDYKNHVFYFISGSEGFLNIRTWKNYKELLREIPFIVLIRKEEHISKVKELIKQEGIEYTENTDINYKVPLIYLIKYDSDTINISSTLIRNRLKNKKRVDNLIDKDIKDIIQENKLYES